MLSMKIRFPYRSVDEWKRVPNTGMLEQTMYEEYRAWSHRKARNFGVTDFDLGEVKIRYQAKTSTIRLLKRQEGEGLQAGSDQQEVLSWYIGEAGGHL